MATCGMSGVLYGVERIVQDSTHQRMVQRSSMCPQMVSGRGGGGG